MTQPAPAEDPRQRRLLEAALATFLRFGFRKTSMEEVARAAHVSRQGLYLHFPSKEALFRAVIQHAARAGLAEAGARLRESARAPRTLEERLIGAFDEWTGRYVGLVGEHVADLHEATSVVGGEIIAGYDERFLDLVVKAIRGSKLPAAFKARHITARQLAETLHAVARGLKHSCSSRADFVERFAVAVRALCAAASE